MVAWSASRRSRAKGGFVTLGTVVGLLAAMVITLFGTGAANHAVASFDASSWLWSRGKGELARVNGVTGRVDTRTKITDAQGHVLQVSQSDRYVILRDLDTGRISVLDLSSLTVGASTTSTPGLGVTVSVHDSTVFVVDAVQGQVRQIDPASLSPIGQALSFPPGLGGGAFDDNGLLWLLVPSEGTVVAIKPADGAAGNAAVVRTADVADPSHDLALSILDTGVAVLDKTAMVLTTLRGAETKKVTLALGGPGAMPVRTVGGDVPVTVVDDRRVYLVTGDGVAGFTIPGQGPGLQPCVAWAGRLYCADDSTGAVYVLDVHGKLTNTIQIANNGKPLELEVREGHLFINAPDSSTARVVDDQHHVKVVDKYANNVLGGEPPPAPPPPPPAKPLVGPPGAPPKVSATAGNASAKVSWLAAPPNGAPILKYVVEGDGKPHEVGADQRTLVVTGLTNGQEYRFSVYAVNAKGNGPKRAANPVMPTSDVPDPPVSVVAAANPDGTVTVTWPPANGLGHKIISYTVIAVSKAGPQEVGSSTTTTFTSKAADLTLGTQYAFKVVSVNDKGANSAESPLSATVVPYSKPAAPANLRVLAVPDRRGTITASWRAPDDHGAALTGYEVTANGQKQSTGTATSVQIGGFGDNAKVDVSVRAVNRAGPGDPASGFANTVGPPTITLQSASTNQYSAITVNFTATDGAGTPATCTLQITGGASASNGCGAPLTVGGLTLGTSYAFTLTVANAAGMQAQTGGTGSTKRYTGTVICTVPSYCGRGAPGGGIYVYKTPSQNGTSVGDVFAPDSYEAVCQTTGGSVNATPWGGKQSGVWVRIKFPGGSLNYIPYAWFRLADGDSLAPLPSCTP